MRLYFHRYLKGQTPIGVFSNLWPTATSRSDRRMIGVWYCCLHVGTWRVEAYGPARQR